MVSWWLGRRALKQVATQGTPGSDQRRRKLQLEYG